MVKRISTNNFLDLRFFRFKDFVIWLPRNNFFAFKNQVYIQVDGVAIGFPLDPILANLFLSHHEKKLVE